VLDSLQGAIDGVKGAVALVLGEQTLVDELVTLTIGLM